MLPDNNTRKRCELKQKVDDLFLDTGQGYSFKSLLALTTSALIPDTNKNQTHMLTTQTRQNEHSDTHTT